MQNMLSFWKSCTGVTSLCFHRGTHPHQVKFCPRLFSALDLWGGTHSSFREVPCQLPVVWWGCRRSVLVWVPARPRRMAVLWPVQAWEASQPIYLQAGSISLVCPVHIHQGELRSGCETGRHCWKTFEETASTRIGDACLKPDRHKSWSRGKS